LIKKVIIYVNRNNYDREVWKEYLLKKFNFDVELKADIFNLNLHKIDFVAEKLASSRIRNIDKEKQPGIYFPAEVEYEKRRIREERNTFGIIYDGYEYVDIIRSLIKREELELDILNIIITDQLIATFDRDDLRWHLRFAVFSFPSVISIPGIVEAPAKPREFYMFLNKGFDRDILKEKFRDRILTIGDKRIKDVIKGILVQSVFYHINGDPFCSQKFCRLYNAHWQEELLYSQIYSEKEFCDYHSNLISKFKI